MSGDFIIDTRLTQNLNISKLVKRLKLNLHQLKHIIPRRNPTPCHLKFIIPSLDLTDSTDAQHEGRGSLSYLRYKENPDIFKPLSKAHIWLSMIHAQLKSNAWVCQYSSPCYLWKLYNSSIPHKSQHFLQISDNNQTLKIVFCFMITY